MTVGLSHFGCKRELPGRLRWEILRSALGTWDIDYRLEAINSLIDASTMLPRLQALPRFGTLNRTMKFCAYIYSGP